MRLWQQMGVVAALSLAVFGAVQAQVALAAQVATQLGLAHAFIDIDNPA